MRAFHLLCGGLALAATLEASAAPHALSAAQWREDLRVLAEELPREHRDPFTKVTPEAFRAAVEALHRKIPDLEDHEIVIGLAGIAALLGDGHTRLTLPQDPDVAFRREHTPTPPPKVEGLVLHHLPVRFVPLADGLFIRAATEAWRGLVGAQVLEVGRLPADEALARVRPTVNCDNDSGCRFLTPVYLAIPEVLHATGVISDPARTRLRVRDASGAVREVELEPLVLGSKPRLLEAAEAIGRPPPRWLAHRDRPYWLEVLPRERALYVQLNEVTEDPREDAASFARRVERTLARSGAKRLVLDLRLNPGGSFELSRPLLLALVRSERVNRPGGLFVLIGGATFSAAQLMVNQLEFLTSAIFVGEPSGASPSGFGDSRKFQLPNSGLTVRASSVYWRDLTPDEKRPHTAPDLPIAPSSRDYFSQRDPVLDEVLSHPEQSAGAWASEVAIQAGVSAALRLVSVYSTDPRHAGEDLEPMMRQVGEALLRSRRSSDAVAWFELTRDSFPHSAEVLVGLARAQLAAGEKAKAHEALEKALELAPRHAAARALLEKTAP